ncbi:unnamed protein product [Cercopithifilaria johnstoni]|uniref:Uncharacterized protein n=1 Tax=Cercopithifilaria johnstoni TaxID=2874296 RepID=A0A8J2PWD0_9BILA|nr:unnamed protein product [Cercopithifilaria johnstoni]
MSTENTLPELHCCVVVYVPSDIYTSGVVPLCRKCHMGELGMSHGSHEGCGSYCPNDVSIYQLTNSGITGSNICIR